MKQLWGIDLGGTKSECVVINHADNPQIISCRRIPTESKKGHEHILRQIKTLVEQTSADCSILGGGISNIPRLYSESVPHIAKYIFNNRVNAKIIKNELGDSAGVIGAALLVGDKESD